MDVLLPGSVVSHYRIVGKIGEGGMGAVYRAEDLRLQRPVAIKLVSSELRENQQALNRLLQEARAASALSHPHIVTIYAVEETEETAFLAMELVDGETLRDRISREPLDPDTIVRLGIEIADALDAAHAAGIIHRDIKPSNILLTGRGSAKVLDFGVAKRVHSERVPSGRPSFPQDIERTQTSTGLAGTVAYMSPEQARGDPLDARSDIFSLGALLYEAATGVRPFEGAGPDDVVRAILREQPRPIRSLRAGLPETLEQILERAMAKPREARFATASEMAVALRAVAAQITGNGPGNLPGSVTSFVGREQEMVEITRVLEAGRCVTLTGAGGCGKSRLAVEAASRMRASCPHGVWLVALAPLADPHLVVQTAATALGIRESPGSDLAATMRDALRDRDLLLIMDNCEHLLASSAALINLLLEGCPRVRILATSREPIGVPGEKTYRVPSLPLPGPERALDLEPLLRFASVRLFVERARALGSGFELTMANADAVSHICRRLDGIPLAIELAAARARVLPVGQILSRLEDCFRILSDGVKPGLPRQQTLRATVDWSYSMLANEERVLFDRLGVFSGGMSLEAVEDVCATAPLGAEAVLDLMTHLVDKSLVLPMEGRGGDARYRLLEPLRQYSRERLLASGEDPLLAERHRAYFTQQAERAEPELEGPDQVIWLRHLEDDHDNYLSAIRSALDSGDPDRGLRLTGSIWRFWWVRGYMSEARIRLESVLGMPGAGRKDALRARALVGAGRMCFELSRFPEARAYHEEALEIRRALGDRPGEAMSLVNLGIVAQGQSDHSLAKRYYEESLAIHCDLGNQRGEAICLNNLGRLANEQDDSEAAARLFEKSLRIRQALGDRRGMAISLNGLGVAALQRNDLTASLLQFGRCLEIQREIGDRPGAAETLLAMAGATALAGCLDEARRLTREGIALLRELGDRLSIVSAIEACLILASVEAKPELVMRLAEQRRVYRKSTAFREIPADERRLGGIVAAARRALGPERVAAEVRAVKPDAVFELLDEVSAGS